MLTIDVFSVCRVRNLMLAMVSEYMFRFNCRWPVSKETEITFSVWF